MGAMSAQPSEPFVSGVGPTGRLVTPRRPLTIAEYLAIEEIEPGYTELVEGSIVMSPSPIPRHSRAQFRLVTQLNSGLPGDPEALQGIDVDLALSRVDGPGWSRRPDVVVAPRSAYERIDREGGMLAASDCSSERRRPTGTGCLPGLRPLRRRGARKGDTAAPSAGGGKLTGLGP